ncbi:hypothetical protein BOX15_Mlig004632g2 [Macrostomum lignano]|uniref:Tyrosine-protein kinase n=1 Tax=Macrostomum lignano TaxID=282301 RepID=A0A267FTZ2_9PLAT|nr:hypothetical protein BOX15_Mlig004632g2 [Macrostomum lignano]
MPINCPSNDISSGKLKTDLTKCSVSFQPHTCAFALFDNDYRDEKDSCLPIKAGDELKVYENFEDSPWLLVKNAAGATGLVNLSHIASADAPDLLNDYPWFHGAVTRAETELQLTPRSIDGLFLVRMSTNHPGDLTLSVVCEGQIRHYHIRRVTLPGPAGRHCYSINDSEGRYYPLSELVRHYATDVDDLCCQLTQPAVVSLSGASLKLSPKQPQKSPTSSSRKPELMLHEILGKGEFGEVRKGTYGGRAVAVKTLREDADSVASAAFDEEARLMQSLKHVNLVRYVTLRISSVGQRQLVTEFMSLGSLLNYLRSRGQSVIGADDQLRFAIDVAKGMDYLAGLNLVHRDLAARNVLLDQNCTAKIADFGLTISCSNSGKQVEKHQTAPKKSSGSGAVDRIPLKWTAPECIKDRSRFSLKSDVWSYGILLWEIYSFGRLPYPRISTDQVHARLMSGYRMESPDKCPADVYGLMLDCWLLQPILRPSFYEITPRLVRIRSP